VALFEVGPAYADDTPEGQARIAGGVRRGATGPRNWAAAPRPVDAHDAKADAEAVLAACGAPVANLQVFAEAPPWYHPGRSGTLRLGPKTVLAAFGEVHPAVLAELGVRGPLVGFEVFIDAIPAPRTKGTKTRPKLELTDLPDVERDFAFVVEAAVAAGDLRRAALGADKQHIEEVSVFDVFEGEALGADRKSVAISVRLRPHERTFTDAQIEAIGKKIVAAVEKATGGTLRG
jgi:phenylalanyl-tRNA synthetase beta chain